MARNDPLKDLQICYRKIFGEELAKEVLADLRVFCHATMTTADKNEDIKILEGRRQVFLRIMQMLKVDIEDIYGYEFDFEGDE